MMNHAVYVFSVFLHIVAAVAWIGGMIFLVFVLMPALRRLSDRGLRARLIRETGVRFRLVGWSCLLVLVITGYVNLASRGMGWDVLSEPAFWQAGFGATLAWKLSLVAVILVISASHDFIVGPRAGRARREVPGSWEERRWRLVAIWFGRMNLLLAVIVVALGVMLARGVPW